MSSFELVILLILSETTQQAMIDDDHSMTNTAIAILTLVGAGIVMTVLKERFSEAPASDCRSPSPAHRER